MKNKKLKIILTIFIIAMTISTILAINNKCEAISDVTEDVEYWKPNEEELPDEVESKIETILSLIATVGVIVSVITLSIIGLKFMLGSVEEKAQYKQALLPWGVGAILVFSLTSLPSLIYNFVSDINVVEEVQVRISQSEATLKIGEKDEITLSATTSNQNKTVRWMTTNNQVATVDSNGKVTAKSVGTAVVKAVSGNGEASCKITVEASKTTSITLSKTSITFNAPIENTYQLTATKTPANSIDTIKWSSSNNNVATVVNGKVRAVGTGNATITATSGEKSANCTVQVNSSRVYKTQYYNPSNNVVSAEKTSNNDLGFWIYIPEISKVKDIEKIPLIVFLHGTGEWRR